MQYEFLIEGVCSYGGS